MVFRKLDIRRHIRSLTEDVNFHSHSSRTLKHFNIWRHKECPRAKVQHEVYIGISEFKCFRYGIHE